MNLKQIVFGSIILILLASCSGTETAETYNDQPKNVILLISDGTGLSQISSAFYFKETPPNYQRFKTIGLINTSSSREKVTDSAAAGTAFASGVKTYNGAIGVDDDSTEVETLVEIAARKGIKNGVIATSSITHATPASFFAHEFSRGWAENIALDMANSDVDFIAGGGIHYFNKREDGRNLLEEMVENNFMVDTTSLASFDAIQSQQKAVFLLAGNAMPRMLDGREDFLPAATELGIQFLNKGGDNFFMMVEGSQIDWGGHDNEADYLVTELIDFDNAIGKALDFAEKDGNTLVVVTSDHETGGYTLSAKAYIGEDGRERRDYRDIGATFSNGGHSATLIPVFAYGPGAETFAGIYQNTEIFDKILELTKWGEEEK